MRLDKTTAMPRTASGQRASESPNEPAPPPPVAEHVFACSCIRDYP